MRIVSVEFCHPIRLVARAGQQREHVLTTIGSRNPTVDIDWDRRALFVAPYHAEDAPEPNPVCIPLENVALIEFESDE